VPSASRKPFDASLFCTSLLSDLAGFLPVGTVDSGAKPLPGAELDWERWLRRHFPQVCSAPFADRHIGLWEWVESLRPGHKPRPRVEIWPRGGAKSTTTELGCARLGVTAQRSFPLYVSKTQKLANQHVQAIGSLFERLGIERAVNEYGFSRGWTTSLLRTANGFNVAAFGLDAGARGVKLDWFRPDLIILDDVDDRHDSEDTVTKKIETITQTLLPAGSFDCGVLFVQNMIHKGSAAAQLANGTADFLHNREPVRVYKAVDELEVEHRPEPDGTARYFIVKGSASWEGQNLRTCEAQINEWGLKAFRREAQQEVDEEEGGLWSRELIKATRLQAHPELRRIGVGVDPNTTSNGDEAGIVVAGIARIGDRDHGYVLEDATVSGGPKAWSEAAVAAYNRHEADFIVAEKNNGGDMVALTIESVDKAPRIKLVHASRGKITRAEPVQKLYADGRAHHVGIFDALETEMCTYKADSGMPSPNRMDALVWVLTELLLGQHELQTDDALHRAFWNRDEQEEEDFTA
jgi:hypothetical protein